LGVKMCPQVLQSHRCLPCLRPFLMTLFDPQKKQIFPIKEKFATTPYKSKGYEKFRYPNVI
ncbi:hypothetical protein, partial [Fibrobacter sp.]|uniref:hypothetical protein n=1 Tax=Fibrobacter sp. TaxID=35828 RepID=UPI0025C5C485